MKRKRKESPTASTATARNKITATTVSVECTRSGSGSDSSGSNRSNTNTVHNKTKQAAKLPPTRSGWTMQEALTHLCTADNRFTRVVNSHALPLNFHKKTKAKDAYTTLLQSIIFQQLGIKVAEVIYNRFCSAIGVLNPDDNISPSVVNEAKFSVKDVDGKSKVSVNGAVVGLSNAKSSYIQSLTEHFLDANSLQGIDFDTLSDDETFAKLNVVKGLGAWSIHMFMIFHLHRPDVLPIGELHVY
jgi:DNA-3-methyladenine glycosylase II